MVYELSSRPGFAWMVNPVLNDKSYDLSRKALINTEFISRENIP
jgi:hypothetical protein